MRGCRAVVVFLLVASLFGCGREVEPATQRAPVLVHGATVATVAAEAIPEFQEAVGTVRARNAAPVASRLAGSVSRVYVKEGDRVAKGQLLVLIESAESGAAAAGARSGVEEAARSLEEARSRQRLADATFERYRRLFDEQAVTRQEFELRQMEQEVAQEGVARFRARLDQARQSASAAGTTAGYAKVRAPISGMVLAKQVEAGQTVFPGTPLVTVEGDQGYRLEVALPEALLGQVRQGERVALSVQGAAQAGKIAEVVPLVDPLSRTCTVKIDLEGKGLRSGVYGKAMFQVGERQGIAVPAAAIVKRGALTSVWTVSPEGIARLRLVKLGRELNGRVEVVSGLSPGESIVVAGTDRVSDGAKVR